MLTSVKPIRSQASTFLPLGKKIHALLVWPYLPDSFWGYSGLGKILDRPGFFPPLGLITVAALCPQSWTLRLVDENIGTLLDEDIRWADLVMVSGMHTQSASIVEVLQRARRFGKRTIIGGPRASAEPEMLADCADHVVVGEPDLVFSQIARELEDGTAKRRYVVDEKPELNITPSPRYDLLNMDRYGAMSVQFSRGCPFQCEFCDIITIYGRRPRARSNNQVLADLDELLQLGWDRDVFFVDDNFIGNRKRTLSMVVELARWIKERNYPFPFFTEASIDLAQYPELIDAMVHANFYFVFIGIESPSADSLNEMKKFQNLRVDMLESIRFIQSRGLWITGGFIVGFDTDTAEIFEDQIALATDAAIPFATPGLLQALPTTPLYERMQKEGRLLAQVPPSRYFGRPNFVTRMPLRDLLTGYRGLIAGLYNPAAYFERSFQSIRHWKPTVNQRPIRIPWIDSFRVVLRSLWYQGVRSDYRIHYWKYLWRIIVHWTWQPYRRSLAFVTLIHGHHLIPFGKMVVEEVNAELAELPSEATEAPKVGSYAREVAATRD